jgi:LPS sulfotransferase NodH
MFFAKPPRVRFVILFPGRTGSSHLVSCLASHGEVLAEGERLVGLDAAAQSRWMTELYDSSRRGGVAAVGFKTKPKDIADRAGFLALLRARSVRVVSLTRRNLVKLAVSTINARRIKSETGRWNLASGATQLGPLTVRPEELRAEIERCSAAQLASQELAADVGGPVLTLDYDELVRDEPAWLRRATEFLELTPRPHRSTVAKATDDDLRKALADYDGLRAAFASTAWAQHFRGD